MAYDLRLKKMVKVLKPKIVKVKTKTGTLKLLKGISAASGVKVSKILEKK